MEKLVRRFTVLCIVLISCLNSSFGSAQDKMSVAVDKIQIEPLGHAFRILAERDKRLDATEVLTVFNSPQHPLHPQIQDVSNAVMSFDIGSPAIWLHARFRHDLTASEKRNLMVKNIWIDHYEFYFFNQSILQRQERLGDAQPFDQRLIDARHFIVPHEFEPGITELLIRVQTKDSINLPIYLFTDKQIKQQEEFDSYTYGFLYGAILALLAYNLILYVSLSDSKYLFYATFLALFCFMNIAYTGHGFRWFWPNNVTWQMWCGSTTILLYNVSGLLFARRFLELENRFPRLNKWLIYLSLFAVSLFALAVLAGNNLYGLFVAMTFTMAFPFLMVSLGLVGILSGFRAARFFLLGSISAAIGTIFTALAVWGVVPFNEFTFRAVEIGMLIDVILISLALAETVKETKTQKLQAETRALVDPLTNLYNRRGLYKLISPIWDHILDKTNQTSVIMLDIDNFKRINDEYGHQFGDEVLTAISAIVHKNARHEDIAVRWGGEELLIVLTNSSLNDAAIVAERIREQIQHTVFKQFEEVNVTASFGVIEMRNERHIDELIHNADINLYKAKHGGRNQVCRG